MPSKTDTAKRSQPHTDEFGLPIGKAVFSEDEASELLSLTRRQLRRYRTGPSPVLAAFHPNGQKSPAQYRRIDLIAYLSR